MINLKKWKYKFEGHCEALTNKELKELQSSTDKKKKKMKMSQKFAKVFGMIQIAMESIIEDHFW